VRAAVRDRYGPPEAIRVEDVPVPEVAADGVLVRVAAASVNRADLDGLYPRWQFTRLFLGLRRPRNRRLGVDVAGVVEGVGPAAQGVAVGQRVYGDLSSFGDGTFAEFVAAPARAFRSVPDGMSSEVAACLPHAGVLALQGLRLRDGRTVGPGDRVLVEGASGNVGPYLVQIAKARGAVVTGVASGPKLDFVRSLGADRVIDYASTDYTRLGERWDWIVAVDAHHGYWGVRRALAPGGVYLALGGSAAWLLRSLVVPRLLSLGSRRRMGLMWWWRPNNPDDLAAIEALVASDALRPAIDRRFGLDHAAEALRYVDDGLAAGKVVITTGS
jgi:NADPH:quinone reductase-like Zn-dependent oxidoreductase